MPRRGPMTGSYVGPTRPVCGSACAWGSATAWSRWRGSSTTSGIAPAKLWPRSNARLADASGPRRRPRALGDAPGRVQTDRGTPPGQDARTDAEGDWPFRRGPLICRSAHRRSPAISSTGNGVTVTVFPTWFVCAAEQTDVGGREIRRRRLVRWSDLDPAGGRRRYVLDDGKKVEATPIRFVAGCEKGHLQDIDWRWVVHGEASCREPMWLLEAGDSPDSR